MDPDTLVSQEPVRNDRDFNDRKRAYDDRGAAGWNSYNGLAPKQARYDPAYDRRRPAWEDRHDRDGGPTTSRRRLSDGQSMVRSFILCIVYSTSVPDLVTWLLFSEESGCTFL